LHHPRKGLKWHAMAKKSHFSGAGPSQRQLLGGDKREETIEALARNKGELRRALSKEMTMKFTPDLRFLLDESFDRMDETNRLLNQDAVRRDVEGE